MCELLSSYQSRCRLAFFQSTNQFIDKSALFCSSVFFCKFNMLAHVLACVQAVAAALQAGAARRGPGAGQGEDAGGQEVQHPQIGAGGLPPRNAAPQQGARRPQQRDQRQ